LLRVLVYALPIAGSLVFVQLATRLTGTPTSSLAVFLLWWFGMSVAATATVSAAYSLSRRLLPLGALLELSLVFPDEAPSRFRLALRSGTVEELQERLRGLRDAEPTDQPQAAAEILLQLVAALDVHDKVTRGHAERVRAYAASLGKQIGLSRDDLDRLNWAALLHDIGKLEVSAEILNKPGRPTEEEWESLRLHPLYGEALVEPLRDWLGPWADAVGYHHERWDGTGYPRGVAGEAIPLAGRIVAIADVFDVITSTRSYKASAPAAAGREELARCAGTQFDPRLVRAFVNMSLGRMRLVVGPISWLTHAPFLTRLPLTPSLGAALSGTAALGAVTAAGLAQTHDVAQAAAARHPPRAHPVAIVVRGEGHETGPRAGHRTSAAHRVFRVQVDARPVLISRRLPHRPIPRPRKPAAPAPPTGTADPGARTTPAPPPAPAAAPPTTTAPQPGSAPLPPPPTTTAPPVNQPPSFAPGPNQAVLEDAGPQTVAGWATSIVSGPPGEAAQTVSFAVSNDNPSLFSAPPGVGADGTLTYTPALNANGTVTVTVAAHDNGGTAGGGADASAAHTFSIEITPVNDAPSFTPGANQTAVSLLGAVTVQGWAGGITPGPPDESSQSVTFTVVADKPGLFSVQPAIAPDGTLTYRPALLALGTATISIRAVDSGGTANGGVDTSTVRTFTIAIV
jgi:hypothetical protein